LSSEDSGGAISVCFSRGEEKKKKRRQKRTQAGVNTRWRAKKDPKSEGHRSAGKKKEVDKTDTQPKG